MNRQGSTSKILHTTDFHYKRGFFDWVFDIRRNFDAICLTGDLLDDSLLATTDKDDQIDWVIQWLRKFDTPVFVCSGNHDEQLDLRIDLDQLAAIDEEFPNGDDAPVLVQHSAPWLKEIDNPMVTGDNEVGRVSGVVFGCIPYQCDDFSLFTGCDVILYHEPPSRLPVACAGAKDMGCARMRDALDEKHLTPSWVLSGHVHAPRSTLSSVHNTRVSNPGASAKVCRPHHREIVLS